MEQRIISYTKGITRSPGELIAEDGELLECINLKCEGGELKPLLWPEKAGFALKEGEELLYIHKGSGYKNYFVGVPSVSNLKVTVFSIGEDGTKKSYDFTHTFAGEKVKFESVGNTVVVLDGEGMHYVLYKNDEYKYLGQKPPTLKIHFSLTLFGGDRNSESSIKNIALSDPLPSASDYEDFNEYKRAKMDAIMGGINKINSEILSDGKFTAPFLLRYAYRMYDGTSFMQSIPILFPVHTYLSPFIVEKIDLGNTVINDSAWALAMNLVYSIEDSIVLDTLKKDWGDIIKGVDIAVTPQFMSYEQTQKTNNFTLVNISSLANGTANSRYVNSYSVCFNRDDNKTDKYSFIDAFKKHRTFNALVTANTGLLDFPELKDIKIINRDIKNASLFYKFSYIPIGSLITGKREEVPVLDKDFNLISTWELLKDDYISNYKIKANNVYSYNNRINLSDVSVDINTPFSMDDFYPHMSENNNNVGFGDCHILLSYNKVYKSKLDKGTLNDSLYLNRYFYYPDTNAISISVKVSKIGDTTYSNKRFNIPLDEHSGLNGSVYFEGFDTGLPLEDIDDKIYEDAGFVKSNKIYASEVNNPFVFPAGGVNTVGTGDVLGIVSTTKALSQGQFGQFPLLVLSTDGIWAMTVNDEGLYSTKQVLSRDVCNNADSIVQTDNLVFFSSERGLMAIDGANVVCVTEHMKGIPGTVQSLKRIGDILDKEEYAFVRLCDDGKEFKDFLNGCRIGYNYKDNSLYISNKEYAYIYVYDIRQGTFSKLCSADKSSKVIGFVNDYPDTLMQESVTIKSTDDKGEEVTTQKTNVYSMITDHDLSATEPSYGFAMTRALKLGNPTGMKRIRQLKNLKNVVDADNYVKYALWGSNDGILWYNIRSYDGGFKYYRMGLFTKLTPSESVLGSVMVVEEKRNNKMR